MKWGAIGLVVNAVIGACTVILTFFLVRVALASDQYRRFRWERRERSKALGQAKAAVKQLVATAPIDELGESSIYIFSLSPRETALVEEANGFLGPRCDDLVRLLLMHGIRCASDQVKPGMGGLAETYYWLLDAGPNLKQGLPHDSVRNTRNFAAGFMSGLGEEAGDGGSDDRSAPSR